MANPNFTATLSTNELYYNLDTSVCLTDMLDDYSSDIAELQASIGDGGDYAAANHNHDDCYYTESEVDSKLAGKSDSNHTHSGYASSSHTHSGVYDVAGAAASALTSANAYTDAEIAYLLNNSTSAVDSVMELAAAMEENSDAIEALETIAAGKASAVHSHAISEITNLQTTLDGKAASSHNHDSAYISKDLQMTSDSGDISVSWSGKNVVTEFTNLAAGMHTAYSPAGNTGNPNSTESFRFMCHKTGTVNYGWVMAYGAKGSIYTGYIDNGNWQGWKAIFEANPQPLWTGAIYMTETHTITPSKTLSQCRNGWLLLWSDYDPGEGASNTDFYASVIFKRAYTGQTWAGGEWYCDIPSYSAGTATDSEQRVIKIVKVYDNKLVGTANNSAAPRNDVCLRAIYEF